MITEINPFRELEANISPTEFEIFCMNTLKAYAKKEDLKDFSITHNKKIKADDGTYQIDVYAEYTALGAKNIVLVECKKKSNAIKREVVEVLHKRLENLGAHKGILISTSGFQSGATEYAAKHGIALWQICDIHIKHICNSVNLNTEKMRFVIEIEKHLPKYYAMEWNCVKDYPFNELYPTEQMVKEAVEKVKLLYSKEIVE